MTSQYQAELDVVLLAIWVQAILYGVYVVLFCISVYILCTRRKPGFVIFLGTTIAMFSLSTIALVFVMCNSMDVDLTSWILRIEYVANNLIADSLVIYRCFIIWNRNKLVVILPVCLLLATTVLGIKTSIDLALLLSLVTNATVSCLTAARIGWITRQARVILGKKTMKRYRTVIAIILESGAIYSMCIIILLVFDRNGNLVATEISVLMLLALTQIVGIVPTLIIVRVGLSLSIESVESLTGGPLEFRTGTNTITSQGPPCIVDVELGRTPVIFSTRRKSV